MEDIHNLLSKYKNEKMALNCVKSESRIEEDKC